MAGPRSVASALSSLLLFVNLCTCVARLGLGRSGGYSSNMPLQGSGFEGPRNPTSRCEPIEIALCRDIGYNLTSMPNLLGDDAQVEAAIHLREFAMLIELRCHEHVRFFLCSVFAPMCTEQVSQAIPACRPMCEHTRDSCAPIMRKFSFGWPESLRCDRLPTKHDPNALCMEAPVDPSEREPPSGRRFTAGLPLGMGDAESRPSPGATCPNPGKMAWAPRSGRCAPRCLPGVDYLWTSSDRVLARAWLLPLSSLCLASCIFTLLTFLLDPTRFGYPGRPVAFLAASYAVHAATFLGALAAGAERVSCELAPDGSLYRIQDGGLDSPVCMAIFLLHYTSGMASSLWWLLLSLAWYLAAGCKWGHEAIMACSTYFHLLAWGLPALLSCLALALGHVSGDELTGLCRVAGAPVPGHTAAFLSVAPLALCLVLGSSLLAAGFVSLFRIRRAVRASGRATAPLDKLMARLGVYAFLHTLPATGLLTCAAYEVILGTSWAQRAATEPCNDNNCSLEHSIPHIEAFLLKSVLELGVGVTSGVWVWSSKTLLAWGRLCTRCCGLTKPVQGKVVGGSKGRNGSTAECAIWLDSDRAGFV